MLEHWRIQMAECKSANVMHEDCITALQRGCSIKDNEILTIQRQTQYLYNENADNKNSFQSIHQKLDTLEHEKEDVYVGAPAQIPVHHTSPQLAEVLGGPMGESDALRLEIDNLKTSLNERDRHVDQRIENHRRRLDRNWDDVGGMLAHLAAVEEQIDGLNPDDWLSEIEAKCAAATIALEELNILDLLL